MLLGTQSRMERKVPSNSYNRGKFLLRECFTDVACGSARADIDMHAPSRFPAIILEVVEISAS